MTSPHTTAGRQAEPAGGSDPQAGTTLAELLVTLAVMSIVMAVFTTAILQAHRWVGHQEAMTTAQSEINIAFQRLDRELRYAVGVSIPGRTPAPSSIPYVEYLATTSTPTSNKCAQLRIFNNKLQTRFWPAATAVPGPNWSTLASSVTATTPPQSGASVQVGPFTLWQPDTSKAYQRLRISLSLTAGSARQPSTRETSITFTALNSSADTDSTKICPALRPTS